MAGYNMMSRCGESILKNAKLENLISISEEDYVNKAIYLSNNLAKLEELRLKIFKDILNTPLFDSKNFSIDFQKNSWIFIKKKSLTQLNKNPILLANPIHSFIEIVSIFIK